MQHRVAALALGRAGADFREIGHLPSRAMPLPDNTAAGPAIFLYSGRIANRNPRERETDEQDRSRTRHAPLARNAGSLSEIEKRILQSAIDRKPVSVDTNAVYSTAQVGDRIADSIARVGGSWTFILASSLSWSSGRANTVLLGRAAFDPYPFIFLNLVLSMIAALQAPVIMMSQNRQAERDRIDAAHDYEVNLKAEIEIMALHEKLDELRHREMIGVRDDVRALTAQLERIERRLAAGDPAG